MKLLLCLLTCLTFNLYANVEESSSTVVNIKEKQHQAIRLINQLSQKYNRNDISMNEKIKNQQNYLILMARLQSANQDTENTPEELKKDEKNLAFLISRYENIISEARKYLN